METKTPQESEEVSEETSQSNSEIETIKTDKIEEEVPQETEELKEAEETSSDGIEEIKTEETNEVEENVEISNLNSNNSSSRNLSEEENVNMVQALYDNTKRRTGTNYKHNCGKLTSEQLITQGLIDESGRTAHGKDLAEYLANNSSTVNGHSAIGYESNSSTQQQVFEDIINNNGGSLSNLVISYTPTGSFSNTEGHGHAMLVSRIDNGRVYFVDDFGVSNWGTQEFKASSMSVEQFESTYLQSKNNACYMTQIV